MTNPLSPHLQVYRWQVTSVLSILHRITGVVTSLGSMLLVLYMTSFAFSRELFDFINLVFNNLLGRTILIGLTFSVLFYFSACLKHLFWDSGYGLDLITAKLTGWITVVVSGLLTILIWFIIYGVI